jgi:hypothetical protein
MYDFSRKFWDVVYLLIYLVLLSMYIFVSGSGGGSSSCYGGGGVGVGGGSGSRGNIKVGGTTLLSYWSSKNDYFWSLVVAYYWICYVVIKCNIKPIMVFIHFLI